MSAYNILLKKSLYIIPFEVKKEIDVCEYARAVLNTLQT